MLLAVDIGNTHTVLGVYRGNRLAGQWRMTSSASRTADEAWLTVRSFCGEADIPPSQLTRVGISSVVPDLTAVFETIAQKYVKTEPVVVSAQLDLGIEIHYRDPLAVGADRICNAVAGFHQFGGPLIIIDFGTATTFDVINARGDYLGGVIGLGVESVASELHRRAARLPRIELRFPPAVIGTDTVSSMQAGVMFGVVDAVEGMVKRIRAELGSPARVVATGGLAPLVAQHTKTIEACDPSLVLEGIRLIVDRVRGPESAPH